MVERVKNLKTAAKIIKNDGLVVFPTDTVYAIGCSAFSDNAIKKLLQARKSKDKLLQIHIADINSLDELVETNNLANSFIKKYWPGPLTLVFKKKTNSKLSKFLNEQDDSIAIRLPANEIEQKLILEANCPLVAPSANVCGLSPALDIKTAYQYFGDKCDFYLDYGICSSDNVSTVLDIRQQKAIVLRQGVIKLEL